jgi:hypothetical protein
MENPVRRPLAWWRDLDHWVQITAILGLPVAIAAILVPILLNRQRYEDPDSASARGSMTVVTRQSQAAGLIHVGDGVARCPEGYLCVWTDPGYQGGGVGIFRRERDWATFPEEFVGVARQGSSFYNHGFPAPQERLPEVALFTAPDFSGERVCLPNGSGIADAAGSPLEDAVRSNQWLEHC